MDSIAISKNRAAYDQIAGRYSERNADMPPYLIESANRLLSMLQESGNTAQTVLDLGCGTGRDTVWLTKHGVKVMGADLSRGMLAEAQKAVSTPFCQLDMRFLPLASCVFSAVWCQTALLHIPKALISNTLSEISRVLKPGGFFYLSLQRGDNEGFETRPYEPVERYYAHYKLDEIVEILQKSGFIVLAQGQAEARRPIVWAYTTKPV
jgi:ubiquinone/menaquinone biosynthesis C-methylase UbiE